LRKQRFVLQSEAQNTCRQSPNPDFAQHAGNYRIVNAAMGEETFVFSGDDGIADNRRDVLIPGYFPVFACQFKERLPVGIVDGANGGKVKADQCSYIRQRGPIKIDVMDSNCN
jgi:hypothetical protein